MRILVVNAGSSSVKLRLLGDADEILAADDLPAMADLDPGRFERAIAADAPFDAVGHRVVHGGKRFVGPVVVDARVRRQLGDLTDLAPLHQPPALAALDALTRIAPAVPSVACFDTAFHATLPPEAATYAVPAPWRHDFGVRRFGFHGLSHGYAAGAAAAMLRPAIPDTLRVVTCHLGAGASLAAVVGGRCVDTTMGFTPLEGLVMATRSGTVDPGLVIWLQTHRGLSAADVLDALEHRSGLVALAGTADMREVIRRADAGDGDATLAFAVYLHHLRAGIAAMVASLGGLDALVFTGGVGEHAPAVRAGAAARLSFLGVSIDDELNAGGGAGRDIASATSSVRVLVIEAREDVEIARGVRALLGPH